MIGLSARLAAVERMVPACTVAADIGSDHGRLACRLIESGKARRVIAVENRQGPYERTVRGVLDLLGPSAPVSVRFGDGLDPLVPGEAEVVVIAGMGGATIAEILRRGQGKLAPGATVVVQPMNEGRLVREWWRETGWRVIEESLVEDRGLLYEITAAVWVGEQGPTDPEEMQSLPLSSSVVDRYGPLLLLRRDPLLWVRLLEEERKWTEIYGKVAAGGGSAERRREIERMLADVEEVRKWLSRSEI